MKFNRLSFQGKIYSSVALISKRDNEKKRARKSELFLGSLEKEILVGFLQHVVLKF